MKIEKSCGAVVFTRENGAVRYVIIQSKEGYYGFPKGHVEENETETETALREIREETGLNVTLLDGFRYEDSHPFEKHGETRIKHIVYFLAEYTGQALTAQESELNSISLMDYDTAMAAFQFENSRQILHAAHDALLKMDIS